MAVITNGRVTQAIFRAVDGLNQGRPAEARVEKSLDAILLGPGGVLDSLGLVNLIVAIEEEVEDEFGMPITIADERACAQGNNPFVTIRSLSDYVASLIEDKAS